MRSDKQLLGYRIGFFFLLLISWEAIGRVYPSMLSHPTRVISAYVTIITVDGLGPALGSSLRSLVVGWILASLVGVLMGLVLGRVRKLALMFEPFLNALYATPRIALVPLIVVWFGLGFKAILFTIVVMAFFPVVIMTLTGVRNAGRDYVEVARSFCMSEREILFKVILPGALPYIGTGLRLGSGRAVTGMVIGEMFVDSHGIGLLLSNAELAMKTDEVFALILVICLIAIAVNTALQMVEQRLQGPRTKAFE